MDFDVVEPWMNLTGALTSPAYVETPEYVLNRFVIPVIGFFGVLANVFNLVALRRRYNKRLLENGEQTVLVILSGLAVSDILFCLGVLPRAFCQGFRSAFEGRSLLMYYELYGVYFQNVFIRTSTWLTVLIAATRYVAICYPLKTRLCHGTAATRCFVLTAFFVWFAFMAPLLWTYRVHVSGGAGGGVNSTAIYVLDIGAFQEDASRKLVFTYVWAIIGYFIPVAVLAFCNVCLIRALQRSSRLRKLSARYCTANSRQSSRITITLIVLTLAYVVFMSPSEILVFYDKAVAPALERSMELAIVCTNVLQTLNMASHVVLYCIVNIGFRETLLHLRTTGCCQRHKQTRRRSDVTTTCHDNNLTTASVAATRTYLKLTDLRNSRDSQISWLRTSYSEQRIVRVA